SMVKTRALVLTFCVAACAGQAEPALAASCSQLATLSLPHTTITLANLVDAGTFMPFPRGRGSVPAPPVARGRSAAESDAGRGGRGQAALTSPFADLPAFCRVTAILTPSSDSNIKVELWMPVSGWNGKFVIPGNGGFAGTVAPAGLATALRAGYAAA